MAHLLELDRVEKRFGGLPAVAGVSFTVDEGEIVALVGPNGAGKSTLLKAIGGMHRATAGSIRLAGTELVGRQPHQCRHLGVSMVLQTPRPFESMTVLENAALGAMFGGVAVDQRASERVADRMLEFVGLAERRTEPVHNLNLHEKRFLEIARQLAGDPKLILLDEVMAGLNDAEVASSVEMVRQARVEFGVTVLWVEHVMKAVMSLAERVLVLQFGELIADGLPADVMRKPEVITAYLGTDRDGGGPADG